MTYYTPMCPLLITIDINGHSIVEVDKEQPKSIQLSLCIYLTSSKAFNIHHRSLSNIAQTLNIHQRSLQHILWEIFMKLFSSFFQWMRDDLASLVILLECLCNQVRIIMWVVIACF